jgi:oligopeptide/dipeptide ABC transporter ATP-binding protein
VPLLELRDLSVRIGSGERAVAAVSNVDLELDPGEVVGLVGESGAGKTMVARAVTGMLPTTAVASGELLFAGRDVLRMREPEMRRHRGEGAALCFQHPRSALSPVRTAGDQVGDRLRVHGGETWTPLDLFRAVGIRNPDQRLGAYPHELSGGMAQRVMISLALACSPRLLVADEPTTGLDVTLARNILALLRRAATEEERGVLIISHDLAAIAEVCDRIAVMYAGTLAEQGPTAEVLRAPGHPYTVALLDAAPDISGVPIHTVPGAMPALADAPESCPFAPRCPRAEGVCVVERPRLVPVAEDQSAACHFAVEVKGRGLAAAARESASAPAAAAPANGARLLELENVEVVYRSRFTRRGHRALRGVSLTLDRGETVGIVGESGCGKSTLARVALGLVEPSSGAVRLNGVELSGFSGRALRRERRRMQMVFQDPFDTLNPRRTVEQTLADSLRLLRLGQRETDTRIDEALERVGLDRGLRTRRRHELSGGQAQRVGIARALVPDPELVVFDEPTSALDVTVQAQILELIQSLTSDRGRGHVFISHDLAIVRSICDRVAVLYLGKIVEAGRTERVFERPLHPYTRALLASAPSLKGTRIGAPVQLRDELEDTDTALGCPLAPRCPFALERCVAETQTLTAYEHGHVAACWRVPDIEGRAGAAEPLEDLAALGEQRDLRTSAGLDDLERR